MNDLIDRNSLLRSLEKFAPEKHDALVEMLINKEPTVDAIPVEWIKRWSKEPMTEKDMKLAEQCEWNILEWLIADWQRKEELTEKKYEYVTLHHEDIHFIDEDAERAFYESLAERKEE